MTSSITPGKLTLFIGPMFSEKTTGMKAEINKYKIAKKRVLIIKYKGHRNNSNLLTTHNPDHLNKDVAIQCTDLLSLLKTNDKNLNGYEFNDYEYEELKNYDIDFISLIAIDEVQFMQNLFPFCKTMLSLGKDIVCTGLAGDFRKESFGDTLQLVPIASYIKHETAFCSHEEKNGNVCMRDAAFTCKIGGDKSKTVEIGTIETEKEMYEPRCEKHYRL